MLIAHVARSVRALLLVAAIASPIHLAAQDPAAPPPERDALEARVRSRMGQMLKTQLGLSDDQVRRLQSTNQRFAGQRRELFTHHLRAGTRPKLATCLIECSGSSVVAWR